MLFNSLEYIFLFLPAAIIIYFALLKRHLIVMSKVWLVITSIIFYCWWNPKYTPILIISILFNFAIGSGFKSRYLTQKNRRTCLLILGITVNILALCYYKYMNFFIDNINTLFHSQIYIIKIVLPLGISFFTFTQIAYLVDAYKNKAKEYDLLNYFLFVTFFPHLIAGPILHHKEMMPQFDDVRKKVLRYKNVVLGLFLFTIGLFKKVIFADSLSTYTTIGYTPGIHLSMLEGWIVMISYTLQIYFDFSGYTDMALGTARMFNIDLPINFNSPYKAVSIQDFWRRWHITLSRFLKDYVYIPLGGNRKGEIKTYTNIFITFFLGGLWHGASWMFIIWGMLHGLALCINRLWQKTKIILPKYLSVLITFIFLNLTWIFFRSKNITQSKQELNSLINYKELIIPKINCLTLNFTENVTHKFDKSPIHSYENVLIILPVALFIVFACLNSQQIISKIKLNNKKSAIILAILFSIIFILGIIKIIFVPYSEFIYFNF